MKIKEFLSLNTSDYFLKLSDKSITLKDANNKTKGIINDIEKVENISLSRKVNLNINLNYKLNSILDNALYISTDNTLYYFVSNSYIDVINQMDVNDNEYIFFNSKIDTLNQYNINIINANIIY